jgi:hypothetical protein
LLQKYCPELQCRAASKMASQRRWLHKPENRHYFRGPQHVSRVQAWREQHPDYGQKGSISGRSLQETIMGQLVDPSGESSALALQETIALQPLDALHPGGVWIADALQDSM